MLSTFYSVLHVTRTFPLSYDSFSKSGNLQLDGT